MKKTLLTLVMGCTALAAGAQITLKQNNVTALSKGMVHDYYTSKLTGFTSPSAGSNQNWDFSSLSGGSQFGVMLSAANGFSSGAVLDTGYFEALTVHNGTPYGFYHGKVFDEDANGFFLGGYVVNRQSYSLGAFTGNNNDSLVIPDQTEKLREDFIAFPATAGSAWSNKYVHVTNMTLTVSAMFMNNVPCQKVSHVMTMDSVAGWGKLSIPSSNKSSIPYDALLVKRHVMTIDSFYLGGQPAPGPVTMAFGITQGAITNTYTEVFYREGTPIPLLNIFYGSDDTWSQPYGAQYTTDNVTSGIEGPAAQNGFSVYPNPASADLVNFRLHKAEAGTWTLKIRNGLGQSVSNKNISETGNLSFSVDAPMAAGMYIVNVYNADGQTVASSKLSVLK